MLDDDNENERDERIGQCHYKILYIHRTRRTFFGRGSEERLFVNGTIVCPQSCTRRERGELASHGPNLGIKMGLERIKEKSTKCRR